jgi:ribose 5-phosphate isomerase B
MKIALSTDHTGLEFIHQIEDFLTTQGHECLSFAPRELNTQDDYPDFMLPAAKAVAEGQCEVGIVLGGSGQGEAMACNRIKGVRCALFYGQATAKLAVNAEGDAAQDDFEILRLSRKHNHANVLSLGVRFLDAETALKAITIWLETPYDTAERHVRRVQKLDQ